MEDIKTLPESSLRDRYYTFVPEGFEPFHGKNYIVTNDPEQFWK